MQMHEREIVMPVTIAFELSDSDLEHFLAMAREAHEAMAAQDDAVEKIAAATREVFEAAKDTQLPDFISERLDKLGVLADMVTDSEWRLPEEDQERVVCAMAYFANPEDLIPDRVPGIGFLDDAIMAELVIENLEAEIAAYQEFCTYRSAEEQRRTSQGLPTDVSRDDWLADKRAALHSRMRERRRARSASGGWRVRLW
jgi:uncharacterized membrane protein YkvA (DUF1232 family)